MHNYTNKSCAKFSEPSFGQILSDGNYHPTHNVEI